MKIDKTIGMLLLLLAVGLLASHFMTGSVVGSQLRSTVIDKQAVLQSKGYAADTLCQTDANGYCLIASYPDADIYGTIAPLATNLKQISSSSAQCTAPGAIKSDGYFHPTAPATWAVSTAYTCPTSSDGRRVTGCTVAAPLCQSSQAVQPGQTIQLSQTCNNVIGANPSYCECYQWTSDQKFHYNRYCTGATQSVPYYVFATLGDALPPVPVEPTVNIAASITAFLSELGGWVKSFFGLASVANTAINLNLGASYTYSPSLAVLAEDADYSDGSVTRHYAQVLIVDANGAVKASSTQKEVTGSTFTDSVSYTFSQSGSYALAGVVVETKNTFDQATGKWTGWTTPTIIASDKQVVNVAAPAPLEPSVNVLASFISGITSWLRGLFGI